MRYTVERATEKLLESARLLEYRRLNWRVETNHRIRGEFEAFLKNAKDAGFPLELHLSQHTTPNEGMVEITAADFSTGMVDRKIQFDENNGLSNLDTAVMETGGKLVASLSPSGYVWFIAHPRRSARIKPKYVELMLFRPFEPTQVNQKVIRAALKCYLILLQSSSILGCEDSLTFGERVAVLWMHFNDVRNRYELYSSLLSLKNEWAKVIVPVVLSSIISLLIGTLFIGSKT